MVPKTDVQNAVSLNSALMTGSRVVGPALGRPADPTVGYGWTFAVDGLSYLAVIARAVPDAHQRAGRPPPVARAARARCATACATCARCPSCGCRW